MGCCILGAIIICQIIATWDRISGMFRRLSQVAASAIGSPESARSRGGRASIGLVLAIALGFLTLVLRGAVQSSPLAGDLTSTWQQDISRAYSISASAICFGKR